MSVLDAYAVIAFLRDEPAAAEVKPLLESGDARLTAVGVGEVIDHLIRLVGADEEVATLDIAELGLLDPDPMTAVVSAASGRLRARHYHRVRCAVSMADCVAVESARNRAEPLATADPHLLGVCRAEGVHVIVLSGSDGSRWTG